MRVDDHEGWKSMYVEGVGRGRFENSHALPFSSVREGRLREIASD
jgi:hypothetical protein